MASLTTPPCSEGVNSCLLYEPISVSLPQVAQIAAAVGHNGLPVQPVDNRLVLVPVAMGS